MRALVYDDYGSIDRLELRDGIPDPRARRGEVVVQVRRAALNPKDALFRKGRFRALSGRRFPKTCGLDLAGVVAESGSQKFATGQRVFGALDEWRFTRGTLAERVLVREHEIAPLPSGVSDEAGAAAALCGLTALQALRDLARLQAGQCVAIHGASGGVGTLAIQIARALGATVVTTSSERNLELCARLGASQTLDYARDSIAALDGCADVVFDVFGNLTIEDARAALGGRGVFVRTVPTLRRLIEDRLTVWSRMPRRLIIVKPKPEDLAQLARWLEAGTIEAVIDSRFPLSRAHEAFQLLESKRARGKIVIEI